MNSFCTRYANRVLLGSLAVLLSATQAFAALTDTAPHAPPSYDTFAPPARGQSYVDPVFNTSILRLSDAAATPDDADGGNLTWAMGEYSTMTAWNSDDSYFMLQHDSYVALYSGAGAYLRDLPFEINAGSEPRWARRSNSLIYFLRGNQLKSYDVASGVSAVVHTFAEYSSVSGKGESDICFDGDHFVLAGNGRYIFVYQISTGTKGSVLDAGANGFDSLYITPNDNVLVNWFTNGAGRFHGIEMFDRNMVFQRQLTKAEGHMDVTRDGDGSEVLVWTNSADPTPICDNGVVKVRLADGVQKCLISLDWSLAVHIGCPDGNGSCIVGTYAPADPNPGAGWTAYTDELLQVKLDGSGASRLAHHRSRPYNGYNFTPRAGVSRDGTRVVFNSNYGAQHRVGAATEYSDAYLIRLAATGAGGGDTGGGGGSGAGGGTGGGATGGSGAFEQDASPVGYSGSWFPNSSAQMSGGSAALAVDAGARARVSFNGTGVQWIGYKDEWSGFARVLVDGAFVRRVNTYASPARARQVLFSAQNLAPGQHTLEIVVLGKQSAASRGAWIWLDAFKVTP